jgi:hypothetical protein
MRFIFKADEAEYKVREKKHCNQKDENETSQMYITHGNKTYKLEETLQITR